MRRPTPREMDARLCGRDNVHDASQKTSTQAHPHKTARQYSINAKPVPHCKDRSTDPKTNAVGNEMADNNEPTLSAATESGGGESGDFDFSSSPLTLPETLDGIDVDGLANIFATALNDKVRSFLALSENQRGLAEWIDDEVKCGKLLAVLAVKAFVIAIGISGAFVAREAGRKALRVAAGFFLKNDDRKQLYYAILNFIAKFDRAAEGRARLGELIARNDPETAALLGTVSSAIRADIAQLNALADLTEQTRESHVLLEQIEAMVATLASPPLVRKNQKLAEGGSNRFYFGAQKVPFFGRENELGLINDDFKKTAPEHNNQRGDFRWMVIHGPGGAGKSRLGLEIALSWGEEASFVEKEKIGAFNWRQWRPATPTLLIVDYPAARPHDTGKLMQAIADNAASDAHFPPVRLILLERSYDDTWRDKLFQGERAGLVREAEFLKEQGLNLEPVANLWPVFEAMIPADNLPEREATLRKLEDIDPQRRPLFAAFFADAIARGVYDTQWSRTELVDSVLTHSEEKYWWTDFYGDIYDRSKIKRLAAIITMSGGLPRDKIKNLCDRFELLPDWDGARLPHRLSLICGYDAKEKRALPMEPDMLGELFALEQIRQTRRDDADFAAHMLDLPFESDGDIAYDAIRRMLRDFPDHGGWPEKYLPSFQTADELWAKSARADENKTSLLNAVRNFRADAPSAAARFACQVASINLTALDEGLTPAEQHALYDDIKTLASTYSLEPTLRELQAGAATNLTASSLGMTPPEKHALYGDIKALARDYKGEPTLREQQATAARNLIILYCRADDVGEARSLYAEMTQLARSTVEETGVIEHGFYGCGRILTHFLEANDPDGFNGFFQALFFENPPWAAAIHEDFCTLDWIQPPFIIPGWPEDKAPHSWRREPKTT